MCYHIIVVNVFMFTLLSDFFLRFFTVNGKAEAFRFSAKGFVFLRRADGGCLKVCCMRSFGRIYENGTITEGC